MNFLLPSKPAPPPVVNGVDHGRATSVITSMIEYVSPAMAKKYLEHKNERNRKLMESAVLSLSRDIEEGRWQLTGQPIIFDANGMLIDGHHRLTAISRGNTTVPVLVVRGTDPQAVRRIDTGATRTAAHIAHMDGHEWASYQTATVKLILIHERVGIHRMSNPRNQPTKAECVDELSRRQDLMISVRKGGLLRKKKWATVVIAAFCHYVFYHQNPLVCDRFWDELSGAGAGLKETNPVLHLRNRLDVDAKSKAQLPSIEIIALFFRAWISYRDGKPMRVLRWRNDGPRPEPFPEIGA